MNNLVIVESPTKARTLSKFLGSKFQIEASMGHVRDLPKADLGVDIEHDFDPQYIIPRDKKKQVNRLKKTASFAKTIWLATDPDREGEAIAWHISELLRNSELKSQISNLKTDGFRRVVFHEITEDAIREAFEHPRELDFKLIDAQQARRVLDRLVGYKLSPLLWKKVKRGLSAGRVQTVALRLIVERQREIDKFKSVEYWGIEVELEVARGPVGLQPHSTSSPDIHRDAGAQWGASSSLSGLRAEGPLAATPRPDTFLATLIELNGKKLEISNEKEAKEHVANLEKASYQVSQITQKQISRLPSPPFTTSTLQQTAGNKLGFSAKKTMMLAQNLYEHGLITYMRTDSVSLSPQAIAQTRGLIETDFGKTYLPSSPRLYKSKSKNVQEAHEAIRPTELRRQPSDIRNQTGLTRDHLRLYDLIWKRMVASQMAEAVIDQTTVDVKADSPVATYLLRATGSVIKFDGWLKLYGVTQEEESFDGVYPEQSRGAQDKDEEPAKKQVLPELSEGENLKLLNLIPKQHFTQPPPAYTEASLIKKLEQLGIGRPSTYAPIISTIQERFYVERVERKFKPTPLGLAVNDFLIKYFPDIFDYAFTAQMEDQLDDISRGERQWRETIKDFYVPFEKKLEGTEETAQKVKLEVEKANKKCPECGKDLVIRIGKFGKFLACSGFPDCKHTESFEEKINIKCPLDSGDVVIRKTKRGKPFYGCSNWPRCKFASWSKPKNPS